jgi:hypothetical protein
MSYTRIFGIFCNNFHQDQKILMSELESAVPKVRSKCFGGKICRKSQEAESALPKITAG